MPEMPAKPLDPSCPCGSSRALSKCCGVAEGPEYSEADIEPVVDALVRYGSRNEFSAAVSRQSRKLAAPIPAAALDGLLKTHELDLQLASLFYIHADLPMRGGKTIAELALRSFGPSLPARQRAYLAQYAAHPTSLYEVVEVFPGKGLKLRDRLRHFTVNVHERTASLQAQPGWFVLVRVRGRPDGLPVMDPPLMCFVSRGRQRLLDWLADHAGPAALDPREHLLEIFHLWQEQVSELLLAPPPRITTPEGDDVLSCESKFAVADAASLKAHLAGRADFEPAEDDDDRHWTWFEPLGGDGRRRLGKLHFKRGSVTLETLSRERAARGREILEGVPGVHLVESKERDVRAPSPRGKKAGSSAKRRQSSEVEIPLEDQARLMKDALDRHYRKWLDQPIPMFHGRTPRQVAKVDPETISREIWTIAHPRNGMPPYDADWMYAELGVPKLGEGRFEPGVEEA